MAGLWSLALKACLDGFSSLGLNVVAICEEAGIPARVLDDPDARIPLENSGRIWPLAEKQWALPGLGLWTGSAVGFGKLPALDYTVATAESVGEGLRRLSGYWEVVTGGFTGIDVEEDAASDQVTVVLRGYSYPQLRDYALATTALRLGVVGAPPVRAEIAGPPVAPRADYVARLGCPVEFEAERTSLTLAPGVQRRPPPARYPGLRAIVEREVERLMKEVRSGKDPLADVRRELTSMLGPEAPSLEAVAERLELSRRQLQRRLSKERTTFPKLVDDCRRALAEQHLSARVSSVAEIGYLLGFSEPSAFSRAFKRWTGLSPADFRAGRASQRSRTPTRRRRSAALAE